MHSSKRIALQVRERRPGLARRARRAPARGAVFFEYAVVVAIGIAIAAGMVSLGANEVAVYSNARAIVYSSNP